MLDYAPVNHIINDEEQHDVNHQDISEIYLDEKDHDQVDGGEGKCNGEDGCKRLVLRQAGTHQFVVDMVLVSVEERATFPQTHDHHAHHVEHRDDEHRDGENQPILVDAV